MRLVLDHEKRYCNVCECVIEREDMDKRKSNKKRSLNYIIDKQLDNLPMFVFEPLQILPSTTTEAIQ